MEGQSDDERVSEAAGVVRSCFERYSDEQIGFAFNGGKDCVAVLELLLQHLGSLRLSRLLVVHFVDADDFPELSAFVAVCQLRYRLDRLEHVALPLHAGLWDVHARHPSVCAFLTGRRASDPHAHAEAFFTPATPSWAPLMRVAPILRWPYRLVWRFLRSRSVPVCVLYDRGYTSLGPRSKTVPNPRLLQPDGSYLPAHVLQDDADERLSRLE